MTSIVYTSNTGHTRQYAELLGQRLGMAVYTLGDAKKSLEEGSRIIYMGWLMAGNVQGLKEAVRHFNLEAVLAVGMGSEEGQEVEVAKSSLLHGSVPVFYLTGGFEMQKLNGLYKLMMKTMAGTVGKKLENKKDLTPYEEESLRLLTEGANLVSEENLNPFLAWYIPRDDRHRIGS